MGLAYFRWQGNRFAIPVSLVVPGSEIPFTRSSDRDKAALDVIGIALDARQTAVSNIRDTVKLAVNASAEVRRKNVQYNTVLLLPAGKYHWMRWNSVRAYTRFALAPLCHAETSRATKSACVLMACAERSPRSPDF